MGAAEGASGWGRANPVTHTPERRPHVVNKGDSIERDTLLSPSTVC